VVKKVVVGQSITRGFGAGGDVEVGRAAIVSDRATLEEMLVGADIVFITAGLGGGTGTGAAPVVAEVAKETGAMAVGMVTLPFSWEGRKRLEAAIGGLSRLREKADNLILVHNDRLTRLVPEEVTMQEALKLADEAVAQGILVVADVVNVPGDINVDLADIKTVLGYPGASLMAIGESSGLKGVQTAVQTALQNPLLDLSINGAQGVLFDVRGGPNLTLHQVNEAGRIIAKASDPQAMIFFGLRIDPGMGDKFQLTILATGIPEKVS
jgi:cell division protein FtsZ